MQEPEELLEGPVLYLMEISVVLSLIIRLCIFINKKIIYWLVGKKMINLSWNQMNVIKLSTLLSFRQYD